MRTGNGIPTTLDPAPSSVSAGGPASSSGVPGPEVSVLLMASRHREFVFDAIRSVRQQTLDPKRYELIAVHDYDDPALERSIDEAGGRRVRVTPHNIGEAIQAGIRSSRGSILTFLDDDDCYDPRRLAYVLDAFRRIGDLGFFKNGFAVIDSRGKLLPQHPFRADQRRNSERLGPVLLRGERRLEQLRRLPALGVDFNSSCMAVDRALVVDFLRHVDLSDFRLLDELAFFAALVSSKSIYLDPSVLTQYRIHSRNISLLPESTNDPLSHRAAFSKAFLPSYGRLRDAVRLVGPESAVQEAEGLLKVQEAYAALRDPSTARSGYLRLRRELRQLRRAYLVRCEPRLFRALGLFSLAPRLGRWIYRRNIRNFEAGVSSKE